MGRPRRMAGIVPSLLARTLFAGVLWWALVEGEIVAWIPSGLAVLAAVLASYPLSPAGSWRWRPAGLWRFLPYFLRQSVRGGVDVAWRALHPRLPVLAGMIEYPLRLPEGPARACFVYVVSLLPGTLSADLRGDTLHVHLLHRRLPARERLAELESRVAALFGEAV